MEPGWAYVVQDKRQAKESAEVKSKLKVLLVVVIAIVGVVGWLIGPDLYEDFKTSHLKTIDSAAFKQRVSALESEVAKVPASNFNENIRLYSELLKLDPENKRYAAKVAHYSQKKVEAAAAIEAERNAAEEKAQAALKAAAGLAAKALRKEPWVIDLVYQPHAAVKWLIGVRKKNDREYGYASYVCNVLKEHGISLTDTHVRIVDYHAFMSNGGDHRAASLGRVDCATFEQKYP